MSLFRLLLIIHIAGGTISLLLGLYIILAGKGGRVHVRTGNIFFFSMLASALAALPLSYLHPNLFLFIIGVFTSYMLLSGRRAVHKKTTADVSLADWGLSILMLIFGLGFIGWGISLIYHHNYFGIVLLVFGFTSTRFVVQDYKNFKGLTPVPTVWLVTHLQRMTASYIASVTAFLVVNNEVLPAVVVWLLPTVVFTPLIVVWTRKYKDKKKAAEIVTG